MTFDPFGDFETRGYLRNVAGEKDIEIVKRLEHNSFLTGIDEAFRNLARMAHLTYRDVLATHKTLFEAVYPWAGQDRAQTAPDKAVSRGGVFSAHPRDVKSAVEHALRIGQDKVFMAAKPGEVMGYSPSRIRFSTETAAPSWWRPPNLLTGRASASTGLRPINPLISRR